MVKTKAKPMKNLFLKKKITVTLLLILMISAAMKLNAQVVEKKKPKPTEDKNSMSFDEGKIIVTIGYGFPNLYKTIFKSTYANTPGLNYVSPGYSQSTAISGLGPVFVKGE